jgi:hypothetical protein
LGNDAPESDSELEKIRDALYIFARVIVDRLPNKSQFLARFTEKSQLLQLFTRCPMLAGFGSARLHVEKPTSVFGKYCLLFVARSFACQHEMGSKMISVDFDCESNSKN